MGRADVELEIGREGDPLPDGSTQRRRQGSGRPGVGGAEHGHRWLEWGPARLGQHRRRVILEVLADHADRAYLQGSEALGDVWSIAEMDEAKIGPAAPIDESIELPPHQVVGIAHGGEPRSLDGEW
jgi:hypothetical protein